MAQEDGKSRREVSPQWGREGSAQRVCEQIWGRGRGSGRPGEAAPSTEGGGECRGHGEMPKGFRTRGQESGSQVKKREVRTETEQEKPGVTSSNRGRVRERQTRAEIFTESLLCFAENKQQGGMSEGGYKRGGYWHNLSEMTVARATVGAAGMGTWSTLQTHSEGRVCKTCWWDGCGL